MSAPDLSDAAMLAAFGAAFALASIGFALFILGADGAFKVAAATPGFVYTVFCPPYMAAKGAVSSPRLAIRVDRPGLDFISFEDAAWTMMEAATSSTYDNALITNAAPGIKAEL